MKEKVQAAIEKIRPMLQRDGGDVELGDVQEGIVTGPLKGACHGRPMSQVTLYPFFQEFEKSTTMRKDGSCQSHSAFPESIVCRR